MDDINIPLFNEEDLPEDLKKELLYAIKKIPTTKLQLAESFYRRTLGPRGTAAKKRFVKWLKDRNIEIDYNILPPNSSEHYQPYILEREYDGSYRFNKELDRERKKELSPLDERIERENKKTKYNDKPKELIFEGGVMLVELYKLAYDLDRKGLYSEAEEIEEVMKLMAKRVGLQVEDMVSLANHFDDLGDIELADRFDGMAKEAAKKDKEKMLKLKEKLKKAKEKEKAEKEKAKAKKLKEKEKAEKAKAKKEKAKEK